MNPDVVVKEIRALLERDVRINLHQDVVRLTAEGEHVRLEGEVSRIEEKRVAARLAEQVAGGGNVEDYITVHPAEQAEDGAINERLRMAFLSEGVFQEFDLAIWDKGERVILRLARDSMGSIELAVRNGIVKISGKVWSLSHKRFASLLSWWTAGVRNVENLLEIRPEERDNDGEINDAVWLALEKDPLVHESQITVATQDRVVTLQGLVATEEEKRMAEQDVWYLDSAVEDVVNRIEVRPKTEGGHYSV